MQVRHLLNTFDWEQGGKPLPHEEPTGDQLGALAEKLTKDTAPYTDFGLWGPYGRRQQKIMKFQAQVFVGGVLVTKMLNGPSNFEAWRACWRGFRTAMLLLMAYLPGPMDEYE